MFWSNFERGYFFFPPNTYLLAQLWVPTLDKVYCNFPEFIHENVREYLLSWSCPGIENFWDYIDMLGLYLFNPPK